MFTRMTASKCLEILLNIDEEEQNEEDQPSFEFLPEVKINRGKDRKVINYLQIFFKWYIKL